MCIRDSHSECFIHARKLGHREADEIFLWDAWKRERLRQLDLWSRVAKLGRIDRGVACLLEAFEVLQAHAERLKLDDHLRGGHAG